MAWPEPKTRSPLPAVHEVPREVRRDFTPPVQKRRLPNLLKVPRECPDEPARERIAAEAYTVIAKIAEREENGILQPGPDRPPALLIESVSGRTVNRQHLCLSLKIGVPISVGVACAAARKRRERERLWRRFCTDFEALSPPGRGLNH